MIIGSLIERIIKVLFLITFSIFCSIGYNIYSNEVDLVECSEFIDCQNDELPETTLDKFNPRIMSSPKGPFD